MARNSRGGLGRGLSSLIGGSADGGTPSQRTHNRERVVYNENEDLYPLNDLKNTSNPGNTGRIRVQDPGTTGPLQKQDVSRETYEYQEVDLQTKEQEILEETPVPEPIPTPEPVEEVVVVEEIIEEPIDFEVDIDLVQPNPDQPRTNFNKEELDELANSIKREGLIQPILVRPLEDGKYQIIAGERRWQASKLAGLDKVAIHVKEVDDDKALELALIENLQRSDLNPIEEAYGYKRLMERRRMTQADVAQAMSKGRSTIANALRLLELPEEAQQLLFEDKMTAGHARAILSIPSKEGRESLTKKIINDGLTVREAESMARLLANKPKKTTRKEPTPALYKSISKAMKEIFKTNVKIRSSKGKNKIEIEFKDEKDLERIFEEMTSNEG